MPLDRETVVRTALRLLDDVGLERLTLRRIAAELDVQAPALYWHFKNKQELLDAMATTVLVDSAGDHEAWSTTDWRDFLHAYALGLRRALLRHRDGAKMVPGTRLTEPSMYTAMEKSLRVLVDAGFTAETAALALGTVYNYTVGHAIEEQAVSPRPGERDRHYDPRERRKRLDPENQPTVAALNDVAFSDPDATFDDGLRLILDGLAARLENPAAG